MHTDNGHNQASDAAPGDARMSVEEAKAAESRVRTFRDEVAGVAERLESAEPVTVASILDRLNRASASVEDDDLGGDATVIRSQFDAMFDRLRTLAERHAEPVPTDAHGLSADARFLRAMADYLTRRYGLEDGEG